MKIAVSGAHSVGKTTLVNWISERYRLPAIGEQARKLLTTKYDFNAVESDLSLFKEFQLEILESQISAEQTYSAFVVDRPLIDTLVYVEERLCKERDSDISYLEKFREVTIQHHMKDSYDLILHVRPNILNIRNDGYRNTNKIYIEMLDRLIDYYFHTIYKYNYSKFVTQVTSEFFSVRKEQMETLMGWFEWTGVHPNDSGST